MNSWLWKKLGVVNGKISLGRCAICTDDDDYLELCGYAYGIPIILMTPIVSMVMYNLVPPNVTGSSLILQFPMAIMVSYVFFMLVLGSDEPCATFYLERPDKRCGATYHRINLTLSRAEFSAYTALVCSGVLLTPLVLFLPADNYGEAIPIAMFAPVTLVVGGSLVSLAITQIRPILKFFL